jgi:hypothetical protein
MAAIGGLSSVGGYPSSAIQSLSRSQSIRGGHHSELSATFEQDLVQSGLKANVSTDELLTSIQSSIKSAIKDPSNDGKDFLQIIQSAVQKTLEENGVDTEKLTSLLQSQAPDQAGLAAYIGDYEDSDGGFASGRRTQGPPIGHRGPPPTASVDQSQTNSFATGDSFDASEVASEFKRLLADLIKSLPSGSALDVHA